jgi:hypothetical protein
LPGEKPHHGLRINQGKKQQILRNYQDEESGLRVIYGKLGQTGCCVVNAGRCILIGTYSELKNHVSVKCNEIILLMANYLSKSVWPDFEEITNPTDSWQPYVDLMLVGKGNISSALLCSKSDGKTWARTSDVEVCLISIKAGSG